MTKPTRFGPDGWRVTLGRYATVAWGAGALLLALVTVGGCSWDDDDGAGGAAAREDARPVSTGDGAHPEGTVRIWARGTPGNDRVFDDAGGDGDTPVDEARWAELNDRLEGQAPMFWSYMARFDDLPRWTMANYVDAMALYTDDRRDGPLGLDTNADLALRSDDGDLLYIPWGGYSAPDENGHPYPQAVADFSDPAWPAMLVADIRADPDHLGIFLDDVNHHQWVATADGTPTWPAGWTADDWRRRLADLTEALRAEFPDRTIVHNTQPFVTDYDDENVVRAVLAADLQFWEFGWTSTAVADAYAMRAQIDDARRIHELGRGIVHMATRFDPVDVERNLVGYLLTNDGNDVVGDAGADWWGGEELWDWYAIDLGDARTDVHEPTPGLFVRDFEGGTAVMNWTGGSVTWGETVIPDGRAHVEVAPVGS